jgi:hypothetical protein
MLKRHGWRRVAKGVIVGVGAAAGLLGAFTAPAQAATGAPKAVTSYSFTSADGDYIGQGGSGSYTAPDATVAVGGTAASLVVRVQSGSDDWTADLAAPRGDVLRPGVYRDAERAPFRTGRAPGLDVSGDGRGCNEVYGQFTINQIATDDSGAVTLLDASFTQHCESATAPALKGTVKFNAFPLSYHFASDPGDWVGGGVTKTYTNSTTVFGFTGAPNGFGYSVSGLRDNWTVSFSDVSGAPLVAGRTYTTTRFGDADHARLDVGGDGRGCNESSGTLTVTKLSTDPATGNITSLAATFTQHCENGTPALNGTIHYFA